MEIKKHISEKPISYWGNEKANQNFLKTNDNENRATLNIWDAAKAVLRGKFIAIQSYPQ